jgi:N-acetyl-anhydromuramyl-L-alanine amidase AmpD
MRETDDWPVIKAKWFTHVMEHRTVRLIVLHDMEWAEGPLTAENCAHDFAVSTTKRSSHICVDNNSIVQCVFDNDVAYAAPGANNDGIQIEMAGFGKQTRNEWLDDYGKQLLHKAADATAQYCLKYNIPAIHLLNNELIAGKSGIIGHYQASQVYKKSDHTDPGPNFPWDYFMNVVGEFFAQYR